MVFSSAISLFFFVPIVFLLDRRLSNVDAKNTWLLLASLVFYSFGQVYYLPLLLLSVALNYVCGRLAAGKYAKLGVTLAVIGGIGLLAVFKYADFAIRTVNALCGLHLPLTGIALPIGISFFTFQGLSYVIDVYREPKMVSHSFKKVLLYIAFFPQLIAGPIVRYSDVAAQLHTRMHSVSDAAYGARRFVLGLAKKILLANQLGALVSAFRTTKDGSVLYTWLYAVAFLLQIYYDFSGYSDMAIGLGRIFGFRFPENFNYPYIAASITEFWRRWHISLGSWFRDYLYIPLGGNRKGKGRQLFNILIVWLATGLWHGADWNFVLWGLWFAVLLLVEKLILLPVLQKRRGLGRCYVLLAVLLGFILFDASSVCDAWGTICALFGGGGLPLASAEAVYQLRSCAVLLAAAAIGATPLPRRAFDALGKTHGGRAVLAVLEPMGLVGLLAVCTAYLVDGSFNPFLYFRF